MAIHGNCLSLSAWRGRRACALPTLLAGLLPCAVFAADPIFDAPQTNPFGITNVADFASPSLVDIDADTDLDLFVGGTDGSTRFFENTGNVASPSFAPSVLNPFGIVDVGGFAAPDFVDIDGDTDLDLFIGEELGELRFFINTGNMSNPAFGAPVTAPFGITDIGTIANPDFVDIDGDGDLDVFLGELYGSISFFRNTGNSTGPAFNFFAANPFGLASVGSGPVFQYAAPALADLDGDNDIDAVFGDSTGDFSFFRNTGNSTNPTFAANSLNPFGLSTSATYVAPEFGDIDGDGDLDAFVGIQDGDILFFLSTVAGPDALPPSSLANIPLAVTNSATFSIDFIAIDIGSGVLNTALWVKRPGDVVFSNSGLTPLSGGTGTFSYTAAAGDGLYEFFTIATDNATNVEAPPGAADDVITLDTVAPTSTAGTDYMGKVEGDINGAYTADDTGGTGIATVKLFHRKQGTATWTDGGVIPTANSWAHSPTEGSGMYYFQSVATDVAGNVEALPVNGSVGDGYTVYNAVANGPLAQDIATGAGSYLFPMETDRSVTINFANVTAGGTITVSRTEGDTAPLSINASALIDQFVTIAAPGIAFTSAGVTVDYDELLLGGVLENEINTAYRYDGSTVAPIAATANATNNTIDFTATGFSAWYFGSSSAEVGDWMVLE